MLRILFILMGCAMLGAGQSQTILDPGVPAKYNLRELPANMKAVSLKTQGMGGGGLGDIFGGIMSLFMTSLGAAGGSHGADAEAAIAMSLMETTWTNGQVLQIAGGSFLVAYKLDIEALKATKQVNDFPMSLRLIRLDAITEVAPHPDLTAEKYAEALGVMMGLGGAPTEPTAASDISIASRKAVSLTNARQLPSALFMYAQGADTCPYVQSSRQAMGTLISYLPDSQVTRSDNPNGAYFYYNINLGGVSTANVSKPAETPAFYESAPWPDGSRIVAYLDGHVKSISAVNWPEVEAALKLKFPRPGKPLPPSAGAGWNYPSHPTTPEGYMNPSAFPKRGN